MPGSLYIYISPDSEKKNHLTLMSPSTDKHWQPHGESVSDEGFSEIWTVCLKLY